MGFSAAVRSSAAVVRAVATTSVTAGSPLVSVPVLSKRTTSTRRIDSSASRSVTSTPARAARSVAIDTTSGIASPSACGHAMTSTVIVRTTASSGVPSSPHTIAVTIAATKANQKSQAAARSASRWARELEDCASSTRRLMPARVVSSPTAVTSTRRPESVAMVPAMTRSPSPRRTVVDSPVTIDSSMLADPSATRPSAGTDAPGRTTTRSPTTSSAGSTWTVSPSRTTSAVSGRRAASAVRAEAVCAVERISTQWPNSMMTTRSASSHQKSSSALSTPRVEPQDERNATVIASPMRSIIPGRRARISSTAPVRKGRPPHTYMTVPRTGATHVSQPDSGSG